MNAMKRIRSGVIAAFLVLGAGLAHAGADKVGTTSANFLANGPGAGPLGMSGAVLGLAGGVASAAWNPAALGYVKETEFALAHAGMPDESNQEWAAFGGHLGVGQVRWALTGLYQGFGSFEGRDATNQPTGEFSASSMAFGGSLARQLGRFGAIGFGAKWVNEDLGTSRGSGIAFDAGLLAQIGPMGIGLAAQNLGGKMKFGDAQYEMPTNIGAGVSYALASGLRADVDVNFPNAYYTNVRAGAEWMYRDAIALRAGYRHELGAPSGEALSGPSFGCGAGAYGMWLDYGFVLAEGGEGQHRMGVSLRPGRMGWTKSDPFGQKDMPRSFDDRDKQTQGPAKAPAKAPATAPAKEEGKKK